MRTGAKEKAIQESNSEKMLEKYHAHSLISIDGTAQESICNACIKPISPPYYKCGDPSECDFLLHKFCADLPLSIKNPVYESDTCNLIFPRWNEFFSLFQCFFCDKYNNGFGYLFHGRDIGVDIHCGLAPMVIKHDSHKQHPLILVDFSPRLKPQISCCGKLYSYLYHCGVCNFSIHIDCTRLPKTVTHKFDKHPLTLTFTSSSQHHSDSFSTDHLCEFCEEDIDSMYWFYHCAECDQSFHVKCIPSVGEFSNIKFGGTVKVPCHNNHPLTLARMLSVGSQTCGYCHLIIEGFKDGMALHCADCDFWIHFKCGSKSSRATVSYPYKNLSYYIE